MLTLSFNLCGREDWKKRLALYGGNPPATNSVPDERERNFEEDEEAEPMAPTTGISRKLPPFG